MNSLIRYYFLKFHDCLYTHKNWTSISLTFDKIEPVDWSVTDQSLRALPSPGVQGPPDGQVVCVFLYFFSKLWPQLREFCLRLSMPQASQASKPFFTMFFLPGSAFIFLAFNGHLVLSWSIKDRDPHWVQL